MKKIAKKRKFRPPREELTGFALVPVEGIVVVGLLLAFGFVELGMVFAACFTVMVMLSIIQLVVVRYVADTKTGENLLLKWNPLRPARRIPWNRICGLTIFRRRGQYELKGFDVSLFSKNWNLFNLPSSMAVEFENKGKIEKLVVPMNSDDIDVVARFFKEMMPSIEVQEAKLLGAS